MLKKQLIIVVIGKVVHRKENNILTWRTNEHECLLVHGILQASSTIHGDKWPIFPISAHRGEVPLYAGEGNAPWATLEAAGWALPNLTPYHLQ